jgi:hypothetical protein
LTAELLPTVDRLYLKDSTSFATEELLQKDLQVTLHQLKKVWLRRKIKHLTTDITKAEATRDEIQFVQLTTELKETTAALRALS